MKGAVSVLFDRGDMFFGTIAGMPVESIMRMFFMGAMHERVAMLLGDDRCKRDRRNCFIALNDGFDAKDKMRVGDSDGIDVQPAIEIDMQYRGSFVAGEGDEKLGKRAGRRTVCGLGDIDAIDDRWGDRRDRVANARVGHDRG